MYSRMKGYLICQNKKVMRKVYRVEYSILLLGILIFNKMKKLCLRVEHYQHPKMTTAVMSNLEKFVEAKQINIEKHNPMWMNGILLVKKTNNAGVANFVICILNPCLLNA